MKVRIFKEQASVYWITIQWPMPYDPENPESVDFLRKLEKVCENTIYTGENFWDGLETGNHDRSGLGYSMLPTPLDTDQITDLTHALQSEGILIYIP